MKVGILGGSGLYDLDGMRDVREVAVETPFGAPSDSYIHGRLGDVEIFFLPRHGRGHRIMPSEINHRANIMGLKMLGVECVLSVSAVGSLREELRPRDIVLPDQYYDRTKGSLEHTFFGKGLVAHVGFGEPTCGALRAVVVAAAEAVVARNKGKADTRIHVGGTYVCMEGPAFSTKAESKAYRQLGFDIIGMTSLPEAKLCREAELCYQAMAMVTDYDCWREAEESVTVEMIIGHLLANVKLAREIVADLVPRLPRERDCGCVRALQQAIITRPDAIAGDVKQRLAPIIGKYIR